MLARRLRQHRWLGARSTANSSERDYSMGRGSGSGGGHSASTLTVALSEFKKRKRRDVNDPPYSVRNCSLSASRYHKLPDALALINTSSQRTTERSAVVLLECFLCPRSVQSS